MRATTGPVEGETVIRPSSFAVGSPCWVDATVPDMEVARRFYGLVFGWAFADQGRDYGHYTMCLLNDIPVAALMPPRPDDGAPPMWNVYLATPDVDAAARVAGQHDGKLIVQPVDIADSGRMAFVADPTGATFGLWQGRGHVGAGLWGDPGAVTWNELATPDGAVADAFYRAVFDYDEQAPADSGVTVWKAGGHEVCSRRETTEVAAQWITYFAVADTDEAVGKVRRQGGRVEREPWDSPYGRLACVADPAGISFRLAGPVPGA
ncbi:VOC family protein [Actinopolymorpha singaporensis]|uniref:VOC domain-containing protein n=1 Tax=Actinopolymorpha singaporensis TaxID=117157 RepID=A0A1H1LE18_9ACTN|nr:VOC family protein [Actinopolymorpha singaporensis]SDR72129.1 hypothetical protein SAMN04489717_0252 [Actinopolymorpha singaporensis]